MGRGSGELTLQVVELFNLPLAGMAAEALAVIPTITFPAVYPGGVAELAAAVAAVLLPETLVFSAEAGVVLQVALKVLAVTVLL